MESESLYDECVDVLDRIFKRIKDKIDEGKFLRDQELRFVERYPVIRKDYKELASE